MNEYYERKWALDRFLREGVLLVQANIYLSCNALLLLEWQVCRILTTFLKHTTTHTINYTASLFRLLLRNTMSLSLPEFLSFSPLFPKAYPAISNSLWTAYLADYP